MRRVALTVVLLAALAAHVAAAPPASACDCGGGDDQSWFGAADAVFSGRAVSTPSPPASGVRSSADPGVWVFEVDSVYKGEVAQLQGVVSAIDGASCGLELPTDRPVLVFAHTDPSVVLSTGPSGAVEGADLYANLCGGSRVLADRPVPADFGTPAPPPDGSSGGIPAADLTVVEVRDRILPWWYPLGLGGAVLAIWFLVRQRRARGL